MNLVFLYDVYDEKEKKIIARDMRIFLKSRSMAEAKERGIAKARENYPVENGFIIQNEDVYRP